MLCIQILNIYAQDILNENLRYKIKICSNQETKTIDFAIYNTTKDSLSSSIYFDRNFLRDPKKIRNYFDKNEPTRIPIKVKNWDGNYIYGELFQRNSNKLLVIGEGFPTKREQMAPLLAMFSDYDILLFDYIGQGLDHIPKTWLGSITNKLFGVDLKATKLGTIDEADVINLIKNVTTKKNYDHVFGLALCFSTSIFIKASIIEPTLFEKLIIDSCWPSILQVIKKVARDPSLICGRQPPSSPCKFITYREWFQNFTCYLTEKITKIKLSEIKTIEQYIDRLNIPVLFFQSKNDCFCTEQQFADIWNKVNSDKIAVVTPHLHGRNYFHGTKLYRTVANKFLEKDIDLDFIY